VKFFPLESSRTAGQVIVPHLRSLRAVLAQVRAASHDRNLPTRGLPAEDREESCGQITPLSRHDLTDDVVWMRLYGLLN
jgi:hypothetical protein